MAPQIRQRTGFVTVGVTRQYLHAVFFRILREVSHFPLPGMLTRSKDQTLEFRSIDNFDWLINFDAKIW